MFGKLVDGAIRYAPKPLRIGDKDIFTTKEEVYLQLGYKPIVRTEPPTIQDGFIVVPYWHEAETAIILNWRIEELVEGVENEQ